MVELTSAFFHSVAKLPALPCPAQPPLKAAFKAQLGSKDRWMKREVLYYSSTSFASTWLYRFEKKEEKSFPPACPPLQYCTLLASPDSNGLGLSSRSRLFCLTVHQCRLRSRWRFGRPEDFLSRHCCEPEVLSFQVWIELFCMFLSFYLHVG